MDIVINELSLNFSTRSEIDAKKIITLFVETHCLISRQSSNTINYFIKDINAIYSHEVIPGYHIRSWVNDNSINKDLRTKFKTIFANSERFSENYSDSIFEISHEDSSIQECDGLGYAYMQEYLCGSFQSKNIWNNEYIDIKHSYIGDIGGQMENKTGTVKHFSIISHFETHYHSFLANNLLVIDNSLELWNNRLSLFPNLIFCGKTETQVKGGIKQFNRIKDILNQLNLIVGNWKNENVNFSSYIQRVPPGFIISPESDSTMSKYGSTRRFQLPNGGTEIFGLHIKVGNTTRIHIYPNENDKILYIGYIGKHLPIASS